MVGTFIFSLQNVQESYYWGICLQLTKSSMDNQDLKIFNIVLSFMRIENCCYLLYFSWFRNMQSFSNSLKALLTVSVIIFSVIIIMQNICNLTGCNSVHIFDIFHYHCANINRMWNAEKLGGIYKRFELTLT